MVAYLEAVDELAKRRQIQVRVEVFISLFGLEFELVYKYNAFAININLFSTS